MTTSVEKRKPPVSNALLWFAFLAPPAAWTAHLLSSYPLVPLACSMGSTAPLNIVTAVTVGIALLAALAGFVGFRRVRQGGPGDMGDAFHRARFMAISGIILGLFFAYVIVIEGLPPVLHDPCIQMY